MVSVAARLTILVIAGACGVACDRPSVDRSSASGNETPVSAVVSPQPVIDEPVSPIQWRDAREFTVEGRGWSDTEAPWDRLPARVRGLVSSEVWDTSRMSAGICVRFVTDSPEIHADWDGGSGTWHMPASGVAGLDLYERTGDGWRHVSVGQPDTGRTVRRIATATRPGRVEYLLFLPLFHRVTDLRLGFAPDSEAAPAPRRDPARKPIVFYGTSIVQGACASRTGMSHTAILSRRLDREAINLGFSGGGKMELFMADLIGEIDASLIVVDCVPNMDYEMIDTRVVPFVRELRKSRPDTPVLVVEQILLPTTHPGNLMLREKVEQLVREGDRHLHYLPNECLLPQREDGTIDGVHPTDYGFEHLASAMEPVLRALLAEEPTGNP